MGTLGTGIGDGLHAPTLLPASLHVAMPSRSRAPGALTRANTRRAPGGKPWAYALLPHDIIAENMTVERLPSCGNAQQVARTWCAYASEHAASTGGQALGLCPAPA